MVTVELFKLCVVSPKESLTLMAEAYSISATLVPSELVHLAVLPTHNTIWKARHSHRQRFSTTAIQNAAEPKNN